VNSQISIGEVFVKLIFGDTESIKLKEKYENEQTKKQYSKLVVKCPVCHTRITQIADMNLKEGWIMWAGCPNPKCTDTDGMQEPWDGITDLKGKILDY
jgi:ssDNA-binding Zn-finger/Zn-ribbon topoisomerase 1